MDQQSLIRIAGRLTLTPSRLTAVADLRLGDAQALLATGNSARSNGAIYLAGLALECGLKARILLRHPGVGGVSSADKLSQSDRTALRLLYSHDLAGMLEFLPEVVRRLEAVDRSDGGRLLPDLRIATAHWAIFIRYSPRSATISDARRFVATTERGLSWMRHL